jgi:hypothetical protein
MPGASLGCPVNPDFAEILSELSAAGVEFIVVGAFAVAAHGTPRVTGDGTERPKDLVDLRWIEQVLENRGRE